MIGTPLARITLVVLFILATGCIGWGALLMTRDSSTSGQAAYGALLIVWNAVNIGLLGRNASFVWTGRL